MKTSVNVRGASFGAMVLVSSLGVFEADAAPSSPQAVNTIYSFCPQAGCFDGKYPNAGLVADSNENLFGTTSRGSGNGDIYELSPNGSGWQEKEIYKFCSKSGCNDGIVPQGDLIIDANGNLYGTATAAGRQANGTVFELSPTSGGKWKLKVLHQFCSRTGNCGDGSTPTADLAYAGTADGKPYDGISPLFGTASSGGVAQGAGGVLYSLTPTDKGRPEFSVLHKFCRAQSFGCPDGDNPAATLVADDAGNLYGTTYAGGKYGNGVLFKEAFDGAHWRETILYTFCSRSQCADGAHPVSALTLDSKGKLYGTTYNGGSAASAGVIFELKPSGDSWRYRVLHTFCVEAGCADGAQPNGVTLGHGYIYGSTYHGGNSQNAGVAFRLRDSIFEILHTFCSAADCADGANPTSRLNKVPGVGLFGATVVGGDHNDGTVFQITP